MSDETTPDQAPPEIMEEAEVVSETITGTDAPAPANTVSLDNLDTGAIAGMFEDRFGAFEDFGPVDVNDLARQSAYRIGLGGEQEFTSNFDGQSFECRIQLNDAILTALSWGEQTSQRLGRKYKLVQGQMRVNADIYARFEDQYVPLNLVFFSIFKRFLNPEMVDSWDYEKFEKFCKTAGFPIQGNYMFNFELLGAHMPFIEKYFPVFKESGAVSIDRGNRPAMIRESYEFTSRTSGLQVVNLEIGGSDPAESQTFGKSYKDSDGNDQIYDNPGFRDPFHAQMNNFARFLSHYRSYLTLKRMAEGKSGEEQSVLLQKARTQRSMATSFLSNFGGVHLAASLDQNGNLVTRDEYYLNRVRCGRFSVQTGEKAVVEMNFWQPDASAPGVAVTPTGGSNAPEGEGSEATREKNPDSDIEELMEQSL